MQVVHFTFITVICILLLNSISVVLFNLVSLAILLRLKHNFVGETIITMHLILTMQTYKERIIFTFT